MAAFFLPPNVSCNGACHYISKALERIVITVCTNLSVLWYKSTCYSQERWDAPENSDDSIKGSHSAG